MALHMWNGESLHIHQLKNEFRRGFYKEKKQSHNQRNWTNRTFRNLVDEKTKHIIRYLLSWPPSLSIAWTKQWCSSGVHLKRGTFDLIYCLTVPLLPQLPICCSCSYLLLLQQSFRNPTENQNYNWILLKTSPSILPPCKTPLIDWSILVV